MTKAEKTRQTIIERSAAIFNKKGIAGTAMSDIMEATGLAKGSLYVHFDNKEKLSHAAADFMLQRQKLRADRAMAQPGTAKEKLMTFFRSTVAPSELSVPGGCPMLNLGLEADDTNPAIRTRVLKMTEQLQSDIARLVEHGVRSGEFKPTVNAEAFAIRSFAIIEGGIFLSRLSGNMKKMTVILESLDAEIGSFEK